MKKIKITINEYLYVNGYATVGDLDGSIHVEYSGDLKDIFNYQYIDGKLVFNKRPDTPLDKVLPVYDGNIWIETAEISDVISFWRDKMICYSKELSVLDRAGLCGDIIYFDIESKLSNSTNMYINACHELAISIDKSVI